MHILANTMGVTTSTNILGTKDLKLPMNSNALIIHCKPKIAMNHKIQNNLRILIYLGLRIFPLSSTFWYSPLRSGCRSKTTIITVPIMSIICMTQKVMI